MVRRSNGLSLIEAVAAVAVMVPILFACLMAVQEVSQGYQIKQGLSQAARQAAQDMASAYQQSSAVASDRSSQDSIVYSKITVPGAVAHQSQFDDASFDTASTPQTVTITVHYKSDGNTNLPQFPSFDPINLGANFDMNASSTYSLQ